MVVLIFTFFTEICGQGTFHLFLPKGGWGGKRTRAGIGGIEGNLNIYIYNSLRFFHIL